MEKKSNDKLMFGFWVYLMTDLLMFAGLFAAFAVLRNNTYGGPAGDTIFSLPLVLVETLFLLISSFTIGLSILAAKKGSKTEVLVFMFFTFFLGLAFIIIEISEFSKLIKEGNGFQRSAFLSSFFTLVGTHGLHITGGLLWMSALIIRIFQKGLSDINIKRLTLLSLFWHFLDLVWIFIFSFVYLIGSL